MSWGASILVLMMLLTVADVVLRFLGKPITGTYELMGFSGALVIGFALAQTTLDDAHVAMDIVTQKLSPERQDLSPDHHESNKSRAVRAHLVVALLKGHDLHRAKEVSLTLRVPFYPVAYGLSLCGFVECLALLSDITV